jgi:16S rRNA (adenine1518-N6/adenine1519-N6)-dimethyltransferase
MTQSRIISLLETYQIKPLESLSQNFFIDTPLLTKVISKIHIKPEYHIIEIGPGLGSLTEILIQYPNQITAIELDVTFAQVLPKILNHPHNLNILHQDILKSQDFIKTINTPYIVIGNIPYHITGAIIRFLSTQNHIAESINLLIQKEVANKLLSEEQSLFKLSAEIYANIRLLSSIPKESFYPKPKVDSSFIQIIPHTIYSQYPREDIIQLAKTAFQQKRKKLSSSLKKHLLLPLAEYSSKTQDLFTKRPQELSLDDWVELYQELT